MCCSIAVGDAMHYVVDRLFYAPNINNVKSYSFKFYDKLCWLRSNTKRQRFSPV